MAKPCRYTPRKQAFHHVQGHQEQEPKVGVALAGLGIARRSARALRRPEGIKTERQSVVKSCRKAVAVLLDLTLNGMARHLEGLEH